MNWSQSFRNRFPGIVSILRNGVLLAGTQWVEAILRGVYVLLISRWLGPELYGAWTYVTTTYALAVGVTLYGLETLVALRLGRDRKASNFLGTAFSLRLGLVVAAAMVLFVNALFFESDPSARIALVLVLPALIGRGLAVLSRAAFLGLDRSARAFQLAVALRLSEVVVGLTCLWFGAGLHTLLTVHAVSWLAEAGFTLAALSRHLRFRFRVDRSEARVVLCEGFVLGLNGASLAFLAAMPLILTRHLTGDLDLVGQIGLATQIVAVFVMGTQGMMGAALPVVGRAAEREDPRLRMYTVLVALFTIIIYGVAIAVAHVFGPRVVPTLLGAGFAPAGALLAPAFLVGGLTVLPGGVWQVLVAQGRRWSGVVAGWTGSLSLFVTLPSLLQSFGASGALAAASIAWGLRAAVLFAWAIGTGKREYS